MKNKKQKTPEDEPNESEALSGDQEALESTDVKKVDAETTDTELTPEARIVELEAALADLKDRSLRALADGENTRRRAEREVADAKKYGPSGLVKDLLNVSDNLHRALESVSEELKESDVIIISAPIYNYGPPATLKAWSDLAARIGETFRFKPNGRREGLLKNKHAYLVITSGGTKLNSSEDFLTPWLKFILNFFGIEKVDIISADQMALDYEKSIKEAEAQIENLFKD